MSAKVVLQRVPPAVGQRTAVAVVAFIFITALSGRFTVPEPMPFAGAEIRFVLTAVLLLWLLSWCVANAVLLGESPGHPFTRWVLLLVAYHACSSVWALESARLGAAVAGDVMIMVMVWGTSIVYRAYPETTRLAFLWSIYLAGVTYSAASLLTGAEAGTGRSAAFGGGPNVFARIVLLGVIAAVGLYLKSGRKWILLPAPVMLLSGVLSFSRGPLSSAVLAAVLALLIGAKHLKARHVLLGVVAVPLLIGAIWKNDQVELLAARRFDWQTLVATGYSGRSELWAQATDLYRLHPFTGNGIDSFHASLYPFTGFSYPHNLVLEIACDLGLVGLVLVVAAWISGIRSIMRMRTGWNPSAAAIVVAVFFVFGCTMFSGDFYDARLGWILMAAAISFPSGAPHRVPGLSRSPLGAGAESRGGALRIHP